MKISSVDLNGELKLWVIYFATLLFSIFIHELGHCAVAWMNGFSAVPTPAKAYLPELIPSTLINYFSLGGVVGSLAFSLIIILFALINSSNVTSALLGGGVAMPGLYSLRFLLQGRGHDGTEFQEAQSALGVSYSGHFTDWLFLTIFIIGTCLWIFKSRSTYKTTGRVVIGVLLTIIFVVLLQKINNAIFDPILSS